MLMFHKRDTAARYRPPRDVAQVRPLDGRRTLTYHPHELLYETLLLYNGRILSFLLTTTAGSPVGPLGPAHDAHEQASSMESITRTDELTAGPELAPAARQALGTAKRGASARYLRLRGEVRSRRRAVARKPGSETRRGLPACRTAKQLLSSDGGPGGGVHAGAASRPGPRRLGRRNVLMPCCSCEGVSAGVQLHGPRRQDELRRPRLRCPRAVAGVAKSPRRSASRARKRRAQPWLS